MIEEPISVLMKGPAYPTIDTWDFGCVPRSA